jgi:hypothetical protein
VGAGVMKSANLRQQVVDRLWLCLPEHPILLFQTQGRNAKIT